MRLGCVETGHGPEQKAVLEELGRLRGSVPDVVLTTHYRPELFGRPFCDLLQTVARGPSDWSVGQRELFAAFVSRMNACLF